MEVVGPAGEGRFGELIPAGAPRSLRSYGFEGGGDARREGVNARLDEMQAAILSVKLPHLHRWVARRRALAERYEACLPAAALRFHTTPGALHARHLFVVRVEERDTSLPWPDEIVVSPGKR